MIKLSKEIKAEIISRVQTYFEEDLDHQIGGLKAEFLLDFFAGEIGPCFYNQALSDCHTMFAKQMEAIADKIYELEKPLRNPR